MSNFDVKDITSMIQAGVELGCSVSGLDKLRNSVVMVDKANNCTFIIGNNILSKPENMVDTSTNNNVIKLPKKKEGDRVYPVVDEVNFGYRGDASKYFVMALTDDKKKHGLSKDKVYNKLVAMKEHIEATNGINTKAYSSIVSGLEEISHYESDDIIRQTALYRKEVHNRFNSYKQDHKRKTA